MIRKSIGLILGLTLILAGQLCFADGERGSPKPWRPVYASGQADQASMITKQSENSYEDVAPAAVMVQQPDHMQVAPAAVMVQQPDHMQVAPAAIMVQQSEQSHQQVAPTAIMVQQSEHMQVAPAAIMVQQSEQSHQQVAPTAITVQQPEHMQVAPAAVMVQQSEQSHQQVAPTAVMVNPSTTVVKQGYSSQVTRALPSMNVSVAGVKGMGPKPQSMKAVPAVAVQATQKK